MAVMGSGNDLEIDGVGGGNPLTSKITIISRPGDPRADVDYLFAWVIAHEQRVDTTSNCDNMLSGVGASAIGNGLIAATSPVTRVRICNVNTGTFIEADVQTPDGVIEYKDNARIGGVPGTAVSVVLTFLSVARTKTGKVFLTDNQIDYLDGVLVICTDTAMPVVIIPAGYLGKTGYELPAELDADKALLVRIEFIRLQTGKAMGLGDVSNTVIPKSTLISSAQEGGAINVRYLISHSCRCALAITGAITISGNCALEGTVTRQVVPSVGYGNINTERPSGALDVHLSNENQDVTMLRASVIRTTRKTFSSKAYLP